MSKTFLRILLLFLFSFMVMFLSTKAVLLFLFLILASFVMQQKIGIPFRYMVFMLLPLFALFGLAYMIEYGFTFTVFLRSLHQSSLTALKVMNLIVLNLWFIRTTSFIELTDAFKRLNLSKKFLFSIMILTSILPLIFKTALQIYDAQRLRGLRKRDFFTLSGWVQFLSPLFIHVFAYAQQISLQLELKDYDSMLTLKENQVSSKVLFKFAFKLSFAICLLVIDRVFLHIFPLHSI